MSFECLYVNLLDSFQSYTAVKAYERAENYAKFISSSNHRVVIHRAKETPLSAPLCVLKQKQKQLAK